MNKKASVSPLMFVLMVVALASASYMTLENTNFLSITGLAVAEVSDVKINSTFATNLTTENLTVYWTSTDADSDAILNITDWRVNGTSIAFINMPFESDGNQNATDYSIYGSNGTIAGEPIWLPNSGHDGRGTYAVDGNDYITISGAVLPVDDDPYAITAWVNTTAACAYSGIAGWGTFGNSYQVNAFRFDSDNLNGDDCHLLNYWWDSDLAVNSTIPFRDGQWHFVIAMYDKTTRSIWVDGVQMGNDTPASNHAVPSGTELRIGSTNGENFNGMLDDVKIYNRSLSPEQIALLYQNKIDIISEKETNANENWTACITPNDGNLSGTTVCSNEILILAVLDTTAPAISNIFNISISNESALINWSTDESANASINYGINESLGNTYTNDTLLTEHSYNITGLLNATTYYYNITTCDASGNCNLSGPWNFITEQNAETGAGNCDSCASCSALSKISNSTVNITSLINSTTTCIDLDGADNVTINCNNNFINSTTGSDYGITTGDKQSDSLTVLNCNISKFSVLLYINGSNFLLENNALSDAVNYAIQVPDANSSRARYNNILNTGQHAFYFTGTRGNDVVVENNQIHNLQVGVMISAGTYRNFSILNNNLSMMSVYAFLSSANTYDFNFIGNNITNQTSTGSTVFFTTASTNLNFSNNRISDSVGTCVQLNSMTNATISNNVMDHCGIPGALRGIHIITGKNITVVENTITNSNSSMYFEGASVDLNITRNTITNASYGIYLGGTTYTDILGNTISNIAGTENSAGIYVDAENNVSIYGYNVITNSTYGVYIVTSSLGLLMRNNSIENNSFDILSGQVFDYPIYKGQNSVFFRNIVNISNILNDFYLNDGIIALNATIERGMNKSANVTLTLPEGDLCPAKLYYSAVYTTNASLITSGGTLCTATTNPACTNIRCSGNTVTFNVPHFDGYAVGFGTAPEVNNVMLNSSFATNFTTENLTAYWNSTDFENDTVVNITDWRINGESYARLNLPFEGGSNSTWTRDYSTYNSTVAVINATWNYTAGHNGYGAYIFDHNSSYIYTEMNASDFNQSMAISLWFKAKDQGGIAGFSSSVPPISGNYDKELYIQSDGNLYFRVYPNIPVLSITTTGVNVIDNVWHHIVISKEFGSYSYLYLDGVLKATSGDVGNDSQGYDSYFVLGKVASHVNFFNGTIDDVLLFNRSISEQEILLLNLSKTNIISKDETLTNENWSACVTPNDGTFDGTTICSNNLTIRNKIEVDSFYFNQTNEWQNISPEENNVSLIINVTSNQNLSFNVSVNADSATFTFSWFINGVLDVVHVITSGFMDMFTKLFLDTGVSTISVVVNSTEAGVNDTFTFYTNITCLIPSAEGFTLNEDGITLCPGSYEFNGSIIINTSNVYLSCDGATLTGNSTNYAFQQVSLHSINNITIRDCVFRNFFSAINLKNVSTAYFLNNTFYNSTFGIYTETSMVNVTVANNSFLKDQYGVFNVAKGESNSILDNEFYNMSTAAIYLIQKGLTIEDNHIEGSRYGIWFYPTGIHSTQNLIGSNVIKNCTTGIYAPIAYNAKFVNLNISFTEKAFFFDKSITDVSVNNTIENPILANNSQDFAFNYIATAEQNNTLYLNNSLGDYVSFDLFGNVTKLNDNYFISTDIVAVNTTAEPNLNVNATVSFGVSSCSNILYKKTGYYESVSAANSGATTCTSCSTPVCASSRMSFTTTSFSTIFAYPAPSTPTTTTTTSGGGSNSGFFYVPPAVPTEPITETPSSSAISSIISENILTNMFACTEIGGTQSSSSAIKSGSSISSPLIKSGYEILVSPFKVDCTNSNFKLSLSLPDSYTDITALRCRGNDCSAVSINEIFSLDCGEDIFENIERTSSVLSSDLFPVEMQKVESKPGASEVSYSRTRLVFSGAISGKLAIDKVFGDVPEATNPKIKIVGTPTTITFDSLVQKSMNITLPYVMQEKIDEYSIAIYALKNNEWKYVGGNVNAGSKTVTAEVKNISEFAENNILTVAAMGLVCLNCYDGELTKVYEGTSKDAVLLIHGFENSPERFEEMINEMKLTNQPWQVWTYGYPSSKTIEENAKELADLLQAKSTEFNYMHIVGHSMGGMIGQEALDYANVQNEGKAQRPYSFVDKVAKVIAVASPNQGTVNADVKSYLNSLLNEKIGFLFNMNSKVLGELMKGINIPRADNVDYLVVAGTMSYDFTKLLGATAANDGLVSLQSAQTIGGIPVNDYCDDFWSLNTSHFDLLNNFESRKIIERIISKEALESTGGKGLIGYNQYYQLNVNLCSPDDQYLIIGKKLNKDEERNPGLCNCGNGICGIDENEFNCPVDCARVEKPQERWWQIILNFAPIRNILMVLLLILLAIAVLSRRRKTKLPPMDVKMREAWLNERIVHIRYHLKMNELDEAATEYSRFVEEYNSSPAMLKERFRNEAQQTRRWVESKIR